MAGKNIGWKFLYAMRDLRTPEIFKSLEKYCRGDILDIGGWDFYTTINTKKLKFNSWTTLECEKERLIDIKDDRFKMILGNGCNMPFEDNSFDLVLNIQVLEHTFEPIKMVEEISRVLKPNGHAIFLIPQTSILHLAPHHYYNFTRFWIIEVMKRASLESIELKPKGGFWTTIASRIFHFFFQSVRFGGMSYPECKRNFFFYLLYPLMAVYVIINIPICMILALGDLSEEPNNHFVLVQKKAKS